VRKKTSSVHDPKVIITVSRLVPKNGIDVLIRAVEEVRKEIPDIRCHILGDGPARETLEMCVSRSRLSPNVKFFGALPHEEIPKYLQEADVFVRPSRSEGMGNSFVEALAVSLPIIGTPVGGILDIIRDGETGLFAAVDNPSDCARKILRLLKDREFGRSIAEKGRKMVGEKFSWDAISKNYEKIFRECHEAHGLRIVMATPLFPPSIGGPATYAKNLAEQFRSLGHRVKILSFGLILSEPILIRHLHYFFRLLRDSRGADIIYALDDFSVGVPAAFVSLLRRIPLAVRWEGDFLWEKFVERTRQEITLPDFYAAAHPLSAKEKIVKKAIGFVLGRASRIGYSSEWRRKIGAGAYGIPPEKLVLVRNVGEENVSVAAGPEREKKILWGGRMLFLKNLSRLIRAFGRANRGDYELWLVGDGPERSRLEALVRERKIPSVRFFPSMDRIRWLHELSRAVCFVLPSFSEVGPTSVTEALSLGVPVIMTRESGYTEILTDGAILVHPFSESEIVQALEEIMEKHSYIRPSAPPFRRGWKETAGEWISLFYESLSHRQRFLHLP
jgi:glycosyltransferase involved in cell wall biosynthesis